MSYRFRDNISTLHALLAILVCVVGCSAEDDWESVTRQAIESADGFLDDEGRPPLEFVGARGWRWLRSHKIEYVEPTRELESVPDDEIDGEAVDPEPDPYRATAREYGEYFRPISDVFGWEYHLAEESVADFGAWMQDRALRRLQGPNGEVGLSGGADMSHGSSGESTSESTLPKKILGSDDRINLDILANYHPFRLQGAMLNGNGNTCTAFKVANHNSAVTTAHCIHTGSSWISRHDIQFAAGNANLPGVPNLPEVPDWCYQRTVPGNYVAHPNLAKNDYAVIIFDGVPGAACSASSPGWDLGYFGWKSVSVGARFSSYFSGYPSDSLPSGWSYPSMSYSYKTSGIGQTIFQPNVVRHEHDSTGGQSGGPLFSYSSNNGYQVRAVHKGEGAGSYNRGREFNGTVADFVNAYASD